MTTKELLDQAMTALAQGVINITEGITTIEHESRVHRAMSYVVELYVQGRLGLTNTTRKPTP